MILEKAFRYAGGVFLGPFRGDGWSQANELHHIFGLPGNAILNRPVKVAG
jgi:hypothetical protein